MQRFEYRVVPAPRKGEKARGLKTTEERFAQALSSVMNQMAREGWDYLRTDTLPVEERSGLTGSKTSFQHMLVFRRSLAKPSEAPRALPAPAEPMPDFDDADAPAVVTDLDPLDVAARRAALIARPQPGPAPRLSATSDTGLAPSLGPAEDGKDTAPKTAG